MTDQEWFCEELERSKHSLYRLALSITEHPEDAAEAVAEGVCRAYEQLDRLREREKLLPWLMKIVRNEAYTLCRRRRRTVPLEQLGEEPAVPPPEADNTLWLAVQRLGREQREAVILFYYEDMSTEEIGRVVGAAPGTVRVRLSRAREKLRRMLEVNDDG